MASNGKSFAWRPNGNSNCSDNRSKPKNVYATTSPAFWSMNAAGFCVRNAASTNSLDNDKGNSKRFSKSPIRAETLSIRAELHHIADGSSKAFHKYGQRLSPLDRLRAMMIYPIDSKDSTCTHRSG